MNFIPWRKKHSIPVTHESGFDTPLIELRSEVDRLFDRMSRNMWLDPTDSFTDIDPRIRDFMPSIDLSETDKQITIRAEIPGMDAESIDITVSGNMLTIHGEKTETTEDRDGDRYHSERTFGSFTRCVELPASADLDDIEAEQSNGVLTIAVQKVPSAKSKKIDVKWQSVAEAIH